MLATLLMFIIVFSIGSAITIRMKWKQENSILTTFLAIGLLLYVFGLMNIMPVAIYIVIGLAIVCAIYDGFNLYKKKVKIKELFTMGTILYMVLLMISSILLKNTYYTEWDEFSHWGPNLKAMVAYDTFWSNQVYDGIHVVYQPLAGIIEYLFCWLNGGFAEDVSYMAMVSFIITLLLPLFRHLEFKIKDFLKGILISFIVYSLIYIFGFHLDSIYIDLLLATLFASSMLYSYWAETKQDFIVTFLLLISMVLLKDTGLLFAGIVLLQLFIRKIVIPAIQQKKLKKEHIKRFGILCIVLVVLLASYLTWKGYCSANGKQLDDRHDKNAISQIDIKEYIKGVLQVGNREEKIDSIAKSFYEALNSTELVQIPFAKTAIGLLVLCNIVAIVLYAIAKEPKRKQKLCSITIAMDIGFVLYCLLLMATYMFAFTEIEGRGLASFARYMNTYFFAWMVITVSLLQEIKKEKTLMILVIVSFLCLASSSVLDIIHAVQKGVSGVSEEIKEKAQIITDNVNLEDKVYLIYQNIGASGNFHLLRYSISPIVTNLLYEWNLGEPYFEGDIWTYHITVEEWSQILKEQAYDYVFIAQSDERLKEEYGSIFAEGTDLENLENHLFRVVENTENEIELQLYK